MSTYIRAVVAAKAIAEKYGIPLGDLVDTFADIPAADVARWCMGGGLRHATNFAPAQYANILFMWDGIKQTTAPTAAQRWTRR